MDSQQQYKILIVGDESVGKSQMVNRYANNKFSDVYNPTMGVNFQLKNVSTNEKKVKLLIRDQSGQERLSYIPFPYYQEVNGFIVVYDITHSQTFKNVQIWFSEIEKFARQHVVKLLVGNKIDLKNNRAVSYDEGKQLADNLGVSFIETSAKINLNIEESFLKLAFELVEQNQNLQTKQTVGIPLYLDSNVNQNTVSRLKSIIDQINQT